MVSIEYWIGGAFMIVGITLFAILIVVARKELEALKEKDAK